MAVVALVPRIATATTWNGENCPAKENRPKIAAKLRIEVASGTSAWRTYCPTLWLTKRRVFGKDGAQGTLAMFFGHHGLKIGCCVVLRFALTGSPFHKEAVAQASKHAHDPNPIGAPNAASVIVVRDIQPLMRPVFNPPGKAIELEPPLSRQLIRLYTGDQRNQFVFATFDLPQQQGALFG